MLKHFESIWEFIYNQATFRNLISGREIIGIYGFVILLFYPLGFLYKSEFFTFWMQLKYFGYAIALLVYLHLTFVILYAQQSDQRKFRQWLENIADEIRNFLSGSPSYSIKKYGVLSVHLIFYGLLSYSLLNPVVKLSEGNILGRGAIVVLSLVVILKIWVIYSYTYLLTLTKHKGRQIFTYLLFVCLADLIFILYSSGTYNVFTNWIQSVQSWISHVPNILWTVILPPAYIFLIRFTIKDYFNFSEKERMKVSDLFLPFLFFLFLLFVYLSGKSIDANPTVSHLPIQARFYFIKEILVICFLLFMIVYYIGRLTMVKSDDESIIEKITGEVVGYATSAERRKILGRFEMENVQRFTLLESDKQGEGSQSENYLLSDINWSTMVNDKERPLKIGDRISVLGYPVKNQSVNEQGENSTNEYWIPLHVLELNHSKVNPLI